ncbi:uncharacterized protein LOC122629925 [Vespula pensylvanica]|uniref:Uncharacterized protein n=1 Tax=Vespula pensylvanica TaxID=30213 RepID=A0A834P1S2_VESPE|nr:uncharacterized protein LOC122629925 [Vespula pensylvanica]XP_043669766.1 uncharacterized protein LOC122629925 [Vespula pensylvanica]KAF7425109.1 hypothetical protein H0235_007547 [Vespula pensylvanica]
MSCVKNISITALTLLLSFTLVTSISKECKIDNKRVTCQCDGTQNLYLPDEYNYKNVTSLSLSSCLTASLLFSSFTEANQIEELVVKNISELLTLELFLNTVELKRFELTNIKRIPFVKHDTFLNIRNIEHFEIRNVHIDYFEEQFMAIKVNHFVMANVTISRIEGFNLSEKGVTLQISNCEFRNVSTSLNFGHFSKVEIVNSKFELQKSGHLSIESDVAIVRDNIFFNVSMNLFAANNITINSTCADGKSSLRLSSNKIESYGNRLPTAIIYTRGQPSNESENVSKSNNTICKAGNCKCPKSNGQNANRPITIVCFLEILLLFTYSTVRS